MFLWVLIGLITGLCSRWIMPGKEKGGFIVAILFCILGAWFGTLIANAFGWTSTLFALSVLAPTIGSLIVLWIYKVVSKRLVKGA